MLLLDLLELLGVGGVRRFVLRRRERGLPDARVDAVRRLDPRGRPLAQQHRALEPLLGDRLPGQATVVRTEERADAHEPRDIGRDADGRQLAAVAAQLVHTERRQNLLDALAQRLHQVWQRVGIVERARVLGEQVGVHGVRAERERDHHVVQVPQAARGEHEPTRASQRAGAMRLGDQRAMRRGDDEQRVYPGAALLDDVTVLHDDERRPAAHSATRLRAETREGVRRVLVPVAVGLEDDGRARRVDRGPRDEILDAPGAEVARELALVIGTERGLGRMAAEQDRKAQLDPAIALRGARARPQLWAWTENDARGEVLDLALAVDRRVGHDGDGLVDVVGEVRASVRERRQRSVPAKRADRLASGLGHVLRHAQVVGLEAKRGELLLAPARDVLELVGRRADLPAPLRLALRTALRDRREPFRGTAGRHAFARAVGRDATRLALRGEALAQGGPVDERPPVGVATQRDAIARTERIGIARVALERDEAALAREDVRLSGLDVPQRAQPEGIHAEHARVTDAREERGRPLRERAHRRARLRVDVLEARRHAADLVDDRREQHLDRLDRAETKTEHETADDGVDVLRVTAVARERQTQRARLVAQTSDRVDLAVVREHRERLHAVEGGAGVRRVAVVAEGHARREALVPQIVEVREELLRSAAQLVDGAVAREADDGSGGETLDLDARLVQRAGRDATATWRDERELPEPRLLDAAARTEHVARRYAGALEQHGHAMPREDAADRRLLGLVGRAGDEEVRDREAVFLRARGILPGVGQAARPQSARDVDEDAGTVAFTVDAARAVRERPQAVDDLGDDARVRPPVLPGHRDP